MDSADLFAQQQASLYEQFLDSIQCFTLTAESSGTRVTPQLLRSAETIFENRSNFFVTWFSNGVAELNNNPENIQALTAFDRDIVDRFVGGATEQLNECLNRCLVSNYSTFISALRFGGAFSGLSGLLKNMHGAMGHVVQQKSREIKWNYRTVDGKTVSCIRHIYLNSRYLAYRMKILSDLYRYKDSQVSIVDKNANKILTIDANTILNSDEFCEKYFYFNSCNFVIGETDAL